LKQKEDTYYGHIMQNKLFEPFLQLFDSQKTRNNLVNSATLELFEVIRMDNPKRLVSHLVDNYSSHFEGIKYVETFRNLVTKNEQNKDYHSPFVSSSQTTGASESVLTLFFFSPTPFKCPLFSLASRTWAKRKRDERDLDESEEAYFNDGDDDEGDGDDDDGAHFRVAPKDPLDFGAKPTRLVDYDEEEETENATGGGEAEAEGTNGVIKASPPKRQKVEE